MTSLEKVTTENTVEAGAENTEIISGTVDKDQKMEALPEGVTEAPQDDEHMDLTKVKYDRKWVRTYLNVSDDEGHFHGDLKVEKQVKKRYADVGSLDIKNIKDPEAYLNELKALTKTYSSRINVAENTTKGIIAKYTIRLGGLFIIQQIIVQEVLKREWIEWFRENYEFSLLRSVQNYMRIADVPKAINYAVFGTERILEILRRIGKPTGDDPIGDFLKDNGIDYDPEVKTDFAELKLQTDIAITRDKLNSEGLEEIPDDKVEALIRGGLEMKAQHIRDLKLLKGKKGEFLEHMDDIISSGGKMPPLLTPERKAEQFKKTIDRFIDQTVSALADADYLGDLNRELFLQLKEKILELEVKFPAPNSD